MQQGGELWLNGNKKPPQVANPPGNQPASPQKAPSAEDVHFIPEQINSLTRNEAKERPSGVKEQPDKGKSQCSSPEFTLANFPVLSTIPTRNKFLSLNSEVGSTSYLPPYNGRHVQSI